MKKNIKSIILIICITFFYSKINAQTKKAKDLKNAIQNHTQEDTTKVKLLNNLIFEIYEIDTKKADSLIVISEKIANRLNYKIGIARAIYYKGHIALIKSNYSESISYFNKALEICESIHYKRGVSHCLNGIGIVYYDQGNYNKALNYYKKSWKIDEELKDQRGIAHSLNNIANIYADKGDYEQAIEHYIKAKEMKISLNDTLGIAKTYNNLGSIYFEQSNFSRALENFNKALELYKQNKEEQRAANVIENIGLVYKSQNKLDKALENFNKALIINSNQGNVKAKASCLNNLGNLFKVQSKQKEALVYFKKALAITTDIKDSEGISRSLNNIAELQLFMHQESVALEYYTKALAINKEIGFQLGICKSHLGIAKVYKKQNNIVKSEFHVLESQKISSKLTLLEYQKDAAKLLYELYKKQGDHKKALKNHEQYKILNDSVFNKENIKKITELEYEFKYKSQLKNANTRELKLTEKVLISNQNLEKSKQNLLLAIIGFLLIAILLGYVIFSLKLKNVKEKTQNITIEQKLLRSQMTSHFIFNSLSVLQGMILSKEEEKSITYLSKFSKLLRIILENSRDKIVSLQQEIKAVENYLILQNLATTPPYNYKLTVSKNISSDLFRIPPMLIQPFVENAVEHAFENQNSDKKIDINISLISNKLVCTITDNGIGIDAHQKKNIKKNKQSLATTITSERLEMLSKDFKMEGKITIIDRKNNQIQGTLVTLIIPYKLNS